MRQKNQCQKALKSYHTLFYFCFMQRPNFFSLSVMSVTDLQRWCCTSSGWRRSLLREAVPCSPRESHCHQTPERARCPQLLFSAPSDLLPLAWWPRAPSARPPRPARCGPRRPPPATDPPPEPWRHRRSGGLMMGTRTGRTELGRAVRRWKRARNDFWVLCAAAWLVNMKLWDEPASPRLPEQLPPCLQSCQSSPGTSPWTEPSRCARRHSRTTPSWDAPLPSWGHSETHKSSIKLYRQKLFSMACSKSALLKLKTLIKMLF